MADNFWDWYEKNKIELFWYKYRVFMGLDPEGDSTWFQERMHFKQMRKQRKKAFDTDNVNDAFAYAPFIDYQPLLEKWWDELDREEKEKYLTKTWFQKMDGFFMGLDWWIPYFQELGYITNCDMPKPTEPIILYRGSEPFFRLGMSWTDNVDMARAFSEFESLISNKYIYRTIVQPESILAILRGDAVDVDGSTIVNHGLEYVVNHQDLSYDYVYGLDDPAWEVYKEKVI